MKTALRAKWRFNWAVTLIMGGGFLFFYWIHHNSLSSSTGSSCLSSPAAQSTDSYHFYVVIHSVLSQEVVRALRARAAVATERDGHQLCSMMVVKSVSCDTPIRAQALALPVEQGASAEPSGIDPLLGGVGLLERRQGLHELSTTVFQNDLFSFNSGGMQNS